MGKLPRGLLAGALVTAAALAGTAYVNRRRAQEAERRHPPIGRFITVDGVRMHYAEWGEGTPVVLLNGNGTMIQDWALSGLVGLAAQQYRVIAIDRPGYGYSERPRDRVWTAAVQAELIARTIAALGLERPVVVGHSWGALVSVALALAHPEATRGLVLLSGYYYPSRRMDVWLFAPPAIPGIGDVFRYTASPLMGRLLAPALIRGLFEPRPVPDRFEERFPLDLALRPSQIRAEAEDSALMIPSVASLHDRYSEIRHPCAVICGADDIVVTPARQSVRLERDLPDSTLHVIPGLGHMVHYDAQEEIVAAIGRVAAHKRA